MKPEGPYLDTRNFSRSVDDLARWLGSLSSPERIAFSCIICLVRSNLNEAFRHALEKFTQADVQFARDHRQLLILYESPDDYRELANTNRHVAMAGWLLIRLLHSLSDRFG